MTVNGDTKLVLAAMTENHKVNRDDIKNLSSKVNAIQDRLGQLNCNAHRVRFDNMERHMASEGRWRVALVVFALSLMVVGFQTAMTYGSLKTTVESLLEGFRTEHEPMHKADHEDH